MTNKAIFGPNHQTLSQTNLEVDIFDGTQAKKNCHYFASTKWHREVEIQNFVRAKKSPTPISSVCRIYLYNKGIWLILQYSLTYGEMDQKVNLPG